MTEEIAVYEGKRELHFNDLAPENKMEVAGKISSILVDVIDKQRLYTEIQGRKYVTVEGWTTLGALVKILPKEREVRRHADGTWEAYVDLINPEGVTVGSGSAICGAGESMWMGRPEYARRSMAITRATGKAYRLGFSWMMKMAGYEVTPAEEMTIEVYGNNNTHKRLLAKAAKEEKPDVDADTLKMLHEACLGKPLDAIGEIVKTKLGEMRD